MVRKFNISHQGSHVSNKIWLHLRQIGEPPSIYQTHYESGCWISSGLPLVNPKFTSAHTSHPTVRTFYPHSMPKLIYILTVSQGNFTIHQWFLTGSKVTPHLHNTQLNKQQRAATLRGRQVERLMENATPPTRDQEPAHFITSVFQVLNYDHHPSPSYKQKDVSWLLLH